MALQRIGEQDIGALKPIIHDWLPTTPVTGQRVIIAALSVAETVMQNVLQMDPASRKGETFRILRTALEYALSVFIAARPAEGVPYLHRWQAIDDPVI